MGHGNLCHGLLFCIPGNDNVQIQTGGHRFAICSLAGVLFSRLKEKAENKKMDAALEKYKSPS